MSRMGLITMHKIMTIKSQFQIWINIRLLSGAMVQLKLVFGFVNLEKKLYIYIWVEFKLHHFYTVDL